MMNDLMLRVILIVENKFLIWFISNNIYNDYGFSGKYTLEIYLSPRVLVAKIQCIAKIVGF